MCRNWAFAFYLGHWGGHFLSGKKVSLSFCFFLGGGGFSALSGLYYMGNFGSRNTFPI